MNMKRILHLLVFLVTMTSSAFAATDDIALDVNNIIIDWSGGGGTKDVDNNAFTYRQYAENYWDIHDLSTSVYDKVEFNFGQAVNYDNINVVATYSDETTTETKIANGATSHTLPLDAGKTLVKVAVTIGWDFASNEVTLYFTSIVIRAKDSTGNIGTMPVKSPKLGTGLANPLLDFHYIADPTAIEYNGRLYVYGTNDHQQYEAGTPTNSYEAIKSLVVISTDDMVNWTYHGLIDVESIAPWIMASWAPTIISKPQSDGTTLFSLYFSNSGTGSGVIQAKSPLGPWTSPLTANLTDGNYDTYWATEDGVTTATLEIALKGTQKINRIMLQEYIPLGQRVSKFHLEYFNGGKWQPISIKEATTTIGYKRLLRFQTITAKKLRVCFDEARGPLCINGIGAYYAPKAMESYQQQELNLKGFDYTIQQQDAKAITIDLGRTRQIRSLHYKPTTTGMISHYEIWAGNTLDNMKRIAAGEFSNIRNNPIMQDVYFAPADCRYVQLKAVHLVNESESASYDKLIIL